MRNVSARVDVVMAETTPASTPLEVNHQEPAETVDIAPDISTEAGILAAARGGELVKVGAPTHKEARGLFNRLAIEAHDATDVTRANGRERIRFEGGGSIIIAGASHDTDQAGE